MAFATRAEHRHVAAAQVSGVGAARRKRTARRQRLNVGRLALG